MDQLEKKEEKTFLIKHIILEIPKVEGDDVIHEKNFTGLFRCYDLSETEHIISCIMPNNSFDCKLITTCYYEENNDISRNCKIKNIDDKGNKRLKNYEIIIHYNEINEKNITLKELMDIIKSKDNWKKYFDYYTSRKWYNSGYLTKEEYSSILFDRCMNLTCCKIKKADNCPIDCREKFIFSMDMIMDEINDDDKEDVKQLINEFQQNMKKIIEKK